MKDPNNLRNRWRRYRVARKAYGFTALPFRQWARGADADSYATVDARDRYVPLIACHCRGCFCCCSIPNT